MFARLKRRFLSAPFETAARASLIFFFLSTAVLIGAPVLLVLISNDDRLTGGTVIALVPIAVVSAMQISAIFAFLAVAAALCVVVWRRSSGDR